MSDEVEALAWCVEVQRDRDELDDLVEVARSRRPKKRFQLRKGQFDRIEVRAVRREKPEACPDPFDGGLHVRLLVHREVVQDDHIAGPERRDEHLLDVGEKAGIVDRAIEDRRRVEAVDSQRGHHGVRLPVTIGCVVAQPDPAGAAPVPADQVGGDTGLIDKDVAARVVQTERVLPPAPRRGDISAALFVGEYRFF